MLFKKELTAAFAEKNICREPRRNTINISSAALCVNLRELCGKKRTADICFN
jgi:hypothetical protein